MAKGNLDPVLRALVGVDPEYIGVVRDIVNRLNSADAKRWHPHFVGVIQAGLPNLPKPVAPSAIIRPVRPFVPASIFGDGWTLWRGPEDGDGLVGEVECDPRSMALTELDLALVAPTIILRGQESYTTSAEQIERVKTEKTDHIRVDPSFAVALRDSPEQYPAAWKGKAIFWDGITLRSPNGGRYSLCSLWFGGRVVLDFRWRGVRRRAGGPSALLASNHLASAA